jgi:2,4-dienoyl-CoA reductase-like NADH-dependent reductase (Old Yellow Enzyme family)/thioredoxin reductase
MFEHLFSPFRIGNLELPNRIVMLPMTTGFCEADETVGDRFIQFYAERARGGAGLLIIPFSPIAIGAAVEPGLHDDRFLPGIRRLTSAIRSQGTKSACQLIITYHLILRDQQPEIIGPSAVMNQLLRVVPREISREEIGFIVAEHGKAAQRLQAGGFDALEILVGAGYLLNRFLSPIVNRREDEYGGSLENRLRITLEIIAAVKKAVGDDFPVGVRLNVEEQMPGGHTVEESKIVARILEKAGVHFINVYTGWHESRLPTVAPSLPKGAFAHLAASLKTSMSIPVIAANRINDPFTAETIIASGQADLVGMGRALLADPELPRKAREGRVEEITPCLACSNCLSALMTGAYKKEGQPVGVICTVNPMIGQEGHDLLRRAEKSKKVVVVGTGPAGLEAAWAAAVRGHQVILFEKQDRAGGWLRTACLPPHKEELQTLADTLTTRALKAGAEIRLNREVHAEELRETSPDVLILAYGADPFIPPIPGVDSPQVVSALDVLSGRKAVEGNVIIIGGGLVGCETGEFLLEKFPGVTSVTILEMMDRMATTISTSYRPFFLARLREKGIRMETQTLVEKISEKGVEVVRAGTPEFIKGDFVILAVGLKTDPNLAEAFRGLAPEIYSIGDCIKPRMIKEAMEEGFAVGTKI